MVNKDFHINIETEIIKRMTRLKFIMSTNSLSLTAVLLVVDTRIGRIMDGTSATCLVQQLLCRIECMIADPRSSLSITGSCSRNCALNKTLSILRH